MREKQFERAFCRLHARSSFSGQVFARVNTVPQVVQSGMQLIELVSALAIVAIIGAVAIPSYTQYRDKANNAVAAADIMTISQAIERFVIRSLRFPDNLSEIGMDKLRDPWGNNYQYLRIAGAGLKGKGAVRKAKKLNPVNSDYDLYSMGKDGQSKKPFTAKPSWDDIVRASNGRFVGLAADY